MEMNDYWGPIPDRAVELIGETLGAILRKVDDIESSPTLEYLPNLTVLPVQRVAGAAGPV